MKVCYRSINFRQGSADIISQANQIIGEYESQGYTLTLRQLYYQFVSRDIIPNKDTEYKRLGGIISDGRYAGLIDWDAIEDRTRNLEKSPFWSSPAQILRDAAYSYQHDLWAEQDRHIEVWVEKEALAGIVAKATGKWSLGHISCRGYMSASEMWEAGQRIIDAKCRGKDSVIIHLGDHDPSGIDMSRDILDRLTEFCEAEDVRAPEFRRIALNMDQVREYDPPPNPAKLTDSRCESYISRFGDKSWELDALEPRVLHNLIDQEIRAYTNIAQWERDQKKLQSQREKLLDFAAQFES